MVKKGTVIGACKDCGCAVHPMHETCKFCAGRDDRLPESESRELERLRDRVADLVVEVDELKRENRRIKKNVEIVAGGCSDALKESGEKRKKLMAECQLLRERSDNLHCAKEKLMDLIAEVDEHFQAELSSAGPWSQYGPPKDLAERVHCIAGLKKEKRQ